MPLKTFANEEPAINMTSMIDVVFFLLIFFMVETGSADMERRIELELPSVRHNPALTAAPEKKVINVLASGVINLDKQPVSAEELTRRLSAARSQYQDLGVLIRADSKCSFQYVAEAMNACKLAGIGQLGISVKVEPISE